MRLHFAAVFPLLIAALPCSPAHAKGTQIWELAGFEELSKGELDGTTVSSIGEVRLGMSSTKLDLDGVGIVWSSLRDEQGNLYLGTGYDGKIYRVNGRKVEHIADTGQLVVTALVQGKAGDLYISTLPEATIWRVERPHLIDPKKPVQAEAWVKLPEETQHVWDLVFDSQKRVLFAGCGPEGRVLAIGPDKKPQVYLDTEEEHILSLVKDDNGDILAGTSPSALLLKLRGPGRAMALADFDATEVRSIVASRGAIYVGVNHFKTPPAVPAKTKTDTTSETSKTAKKSTPKGAVGDGEIFKLDDLGRKELLWSESKAHVIQLNLDQEGMLFAGLGADGRVISIDKNRVVRNELDLDERQVTTFIVETGLAVVGTGDAGAVYSVDKSRPAESIYLSPLLDAGVVSEWGRLRWIARGNLQVRTRSGNTETPDANWSDWSAGPKNGQEITTTPARYLQLSFSFATDPNASLISAEVAFNPQNQRAIITEFDPGSRFPSSKPGTKMSSLTTSERFIDSRPDVENEAELGLSWKVDNPDDDSLRYWLYYRAIGQTVWRPILRDDKVLRLKSYTWKTSSVPEGRYQIRLVTDDSPSNDPRDTLSDETISTPVIIDNHQPTVQKLSYRKNTLSGIAVDSFSHIAAIEFSIDNGPWIPVFSNDGIFDERTEPFAFPLPSDLEKGPHDVAVRALDRGGNIGIAEIHITKK